MHWCDRSEINHQLSVNHVSANILISIDATLRVASFQTNLRVDSQWIENARNVVNLVDVLELMRKGGEFECHG